MNIFYLSAVAAVLLLSAGGFRADYARENSKETAIVESDQTARNPGSISVLCSQTEDEEPVIQDDKSFFDALACRFFSADDGSERDPQCDHAADSSGTRYKCNHAPYIDKADYAHDGYYDPTMTLVSDNLLKIAVYAKDDDDPHACGFEDLQLHVSAPGITEPTRTIVGDSYRFDFYIDISKPSRLQGYYYVQDSEGLTSVTKYVDFDLIKINGFEYQEKSPAENYYRSLSDKHVVWLENDNRLRFLSSPQINYDDPDQLTRFSNLIDYQVKVKEWTWNQATSTYVQSSNWNNYRGGAGVYTLKVVAYKKATNTLVYSSGESLYCFNRILSVDWDTTEDYTDSNGFIKIEDDELAYNNDCCGFVERPIIADPEDEDFFIISQTEKTNINVKVVLQHPIPQGLAASVFLDWFDPINAPDCLSIADRTNNINNKKGKRDNYGEMQFNSGALSFMGGDGVKFKSGTIKQAHSGDNYKIIAHPNEGVIDRVGFDNNDELVIYDNSSKSGGRGYVITSPVFTVKRTLWVERDQLAYLEDSNDPTSQRTAELPIIAGLVKEQLRLVHINVKEFPAGLNLTETIDNSHYTSKLSKGDDLCVFRDSPIATDSFWTVLAVGAFSMRAPDSNYDSSILGTHYGLNNTVAIFNDCIKPGFGRRKDIYELRTEDSMSSADLIEIKEQVLLHEIGHSLGLDHVNGVTHDVMLEDCILPDRLLDANQQFTNSERRTIQSRSKPL
ncbi:MAG: hypothetical protein J6X44_00090 [Thermoguttaceae bacterium]|nr:hypothetical protein [Thermoguttaceae bacterium]